MTPHRETKFKISIENENHIPAWFSQFSGLRWRRKFSRKERGSVKVQAILQKDVSFLNVGQGDADHAVGLLGDHAADQLTIDGCEGSRG